MNLIIVAKFLKAPKTFSLRDPRAIAALGAAVLVIGALGAGIGMLCSSATQRSLAEVAELRDSLQKQQGELEAARADVDRELNALAARLGELQAQSNRVNALGERLTRLAKLDDGEFNFREPPALGGPESAEFAAPHSAADVRASLDAFANRLAAQSRQLDVLENLLLDRDVDASGLPAGLPVRSGYASSGFGMRSDPFTGQSEFHRGVDFNGPRGSDILAVADGVVAFSGRHPSYGNMIDIDHGNGYVTRYAHCERALVEPGQRVRAGDVIAKMGSSGRATGVHVHFEVWLNDRLVNPTAYLKAGSARG